MIAIGKEMPNAASLQSPQFTDNLKWNPVNSLKRK